MQTETGALEFRNPRLERTVALTAADRKWMDDILTDVNETWSESNSQPTGLHQYVSLQIDIGASFTQNVIDSREAMIICDRRLEVLGLVIESEANCPLVRGIHRRSVIGCEVSCFHGEGR